jgi:hypothetical protein
MSSCRNGHEITGQSSHCPICAVLIGERVNPGPAQFGRASNPTDGAAAPPSQKAATHKKRLIAAAGSSVVLIAAVATALSLGTGAAPAKTAVLNVAVSPSTVVRTPPVVSTITVPRTTLPAVVVPVATIPPATAPPATAPPATAPPVTAPPPTNPPSPATTEPAPQPPASTPPPTPVPATIPAAGVVWLTTQQSDYNNLSQAAFLMYADMIGAQAGQVAPDFATNEVALNAALLAVKKAPPTTSPSLNTSIGAALSGFNTALSGDGSVLLELENGNDAFAANDAVNVENNIQASQTTLNNALGAAGVPAADLAPVPSVS